MDEKNRDIGWPLHGGQASMVKPQEEDRSDECQLNLEAEKVRLRAVAGHIRTRQTWAGAQEKSGLRARTGQVRDRSVQSEFSSGASQIRVGKCQSEEDR